MGKKSRKSKAKTSDFQKVKLKVGKKRPLPSNVTEVSFKSQAVYLPEQLKTIAIDDGAMGDDVSRSKNVPELLSQVGHFNSNFRIDSLTSLRIFFTTNKEEIHRYLPKIVEKVPRTIADEEQQVRKSSIGFFKVIFANLEEEEMAPFFDIFLSHLHCAMSHIFDDVQKDSLQIVDLCIEHFPGLLSHKARNTLLKHFIELISTKQTKSAASSVKGSKANPGVTRVLSMKLSNKESSIVWRNRVLKRLDSLLQISTSSPKTSNESKTWMSYLEKHLRKDGTDSIFDDDIRVRWDGKEIGKILTHFDSQKLTLPSFSLRSNPLSMISSLNDDDDSESSPWSLINTLFPLLFDCWHEATSDESKGLTAESKQTMSYVLNIVNVLVERYLNSADNKDDAIESVRDAFMKHFRQYFFESFPLSEFTGRQPIAKKKKLNQEPSINVGEINLSICSLVTTLASEQNLNEDSEILPIVATYLSMAIISDGSKGEMNLDSVSLDRCILAIEKLLEIAVDNETRENLLRPLLLLYHTLSAYSLEKSRLLKFFMNLHSDEKSTNFSSNDVMTEWLCSLPNLLIEILSSKKGTLCSDFSTNELLQLVLRCIRLACLQENSEFVTCLGENINILLKVLKDNSSSLFCATKCDESHTGEHCYACSKIQACMFEVLLHHSRQLSKEDVSIVSQICSKVQITPRNVIYVAEMFLHKFKKSRSPEDFTIAMQFIFTILIGVSKENLLSLQSDTASEQSYHEVLKTTNQQEFQRHSEIVKKLFQVLLTIEQSSTLLQHFICEKILKHFQLLPAKSVYGILNAGKIILDFPMPNMTRMEGLIENLGSLCAKLLLGLHNSQSTTDSSVRDGLFEMLYLLLENKELLRHCIRNLLNAELQDSIIWKSTCQVVQSLTTNTALYESLTGCQDELETLLNALKSNTSQSSEEIFQAMELNLSVLLKK